MIYLMLAIASSALVSIIIRLGEDHVTNQMGMLLSNYVVCSICAIVCSNSDVVTAVHASGFFDIGLGVVCGFLYLAGLLLMQHNTKHNGVVLSSTFMKLGVLIPTLMAIVFFREIPKGTQVIGIVLALFAIVMIHFEKDALKEGNKKLWLLVLLLCGGITDSTSTIFEKFGSPAAKDVYLFMIFFVAGVLAFVLVLKSKKKVSPKDVIFGVILGVPNYFSSRFLLLSLSSMSAVVVYPTYSVATMIVITVVGVLAFKEKLDRKKAIALGMIVLALGLLNI